MRQTLMADLQNLDALDAPSALVASVNRDLNEKSWRNISGIDPRLSWSLPIGWRKQRPALT